MGCCISRIKIEQTHEKDESISSIPKRPYLFLKDVIN